MTADIENPDKITDKKGTLKAALLYRSAAVDESDEMMNIKGNGMEPLYSDGDRVLVKYCDTIAEGEVGAYDYPDMGLIIRYKGKDGLRGRRDKRRAFHRIRRRRYSHGSSRL